MSNFAIPTPLAQMKLPLNDSFEENNRKKFMNHLLVLLYGGTITTVAEDCVRFPRPWLMSTKRMGEKRLSFRNFQAFISAVRDK